jgi:uncharacterized protein (TIGR02996 family)
MKALVEARQALIGGNEPRALDKLVEGWRASKSPHIATLAEKLSKRLEPHLAPIGGKLESFQPQWLAIAKRKRAVDLPRLLGSVLHTTDRFGVAVVDALVARGEALAKWPADPRASAIIVEHLVRGGYESTSKSTYPFWTAMFEMLATTADPRVVDRLAKIRFAKVFKTFSDGARRIAWFQEQLDTTLEKLRTSDAAPLTRAVSERVTKLAELIAARGPLQPGELAQLTSDPKVQAPAPKQPAPKPKLEHATARKHAEAAARAIGSGDDTGALRGLLEAWRATRASRIAELVERVSRRCESRLPRVGQDTRAETHKAWLAIAREQRPEDLPRLLAALCDTGGRSTDALERVTALASWPSDPRTARGAIRHIERPMFYASSTRPFWSALITLVVDHQDPRAADQLDALAKRYTNVLHASYLDLSATVTWFQNQLRNAATQLRTRVPAPLVLDAGTQKACEKIAATLDVEDGLLAAIYADPHDDHARAVYADLLQQRGDSRGEFIALQLANRDEARAAELLRTHADAWLGVLAPYVVVHRCKFERGFPYDVTLNGVDVDPIAKHPAWSTVRRIDGDQRSKIASPSTDTAGE